MAWRIWIELFGYVYEIIRMKPVTKAAIHKHLRKVQGSVQDIFCTLESAAAAFEKAESENDINRFVRASRVVERCRDALERLRDDVDDVAAGVGS